MPRISTLTRSAAIALCLPASAALADLTADDVWSDWKSYMETAGYAVSATEAMRGDTLTVSDLSLEMNVGEDADEGTVAIQVGTVRFVEQRNGSVSIELNEAYPVELNMTPETGEAVEMALTFTQTAPVMTATGKPQDVTYEYAASAASVLMSGMSVDGVPVGQDVARFQMEAQDLSYVTRTSLDTMRGIEHTMNVAGLSYDVAFADPEGEGSFAMKGAMQDIALDGSGALPLDSDPQDLNAMLDDGLDFDGVFTTAGGSSELTFEGPDGSGTANTASDGGEFSIAMGTVGLIYDVVQRNVNFNMLVTEFPLPLSFTAAEVGTSILMPLQKSPEDQEFGLGLTLSDFTMSDVIWGLFDPTGQLPRDPATLVVDLSGQAKVLFDFLDPDQAAVLEQTGTPPGELNALTLNVLELEAAGAKLTGAGDFTFDNSDLVTFDGMPRPLGALDLTLVGGNGLLDKLVGMGLVPQEQAMGARMMMGLFAVPGSAPDTLNSRVEINPEGHVLANGQRIR